MKRCIIVRSWRPTNLLYDAGVRIYLSAREDSGAYGGSWALSSLPEVLAGNEGINGAARVVPGLSGRTRCARHAGKTLIGVVGRLRVTPAVAVAM